MPCVLTINNSNSLWNSIRPHFHIMIESSSSEHFLFAASNPSVQFRAPHFMILSNSSTAMRSLLVLVLSASFLVLSSAAACHRDDESGLLGFKSAITADPSGMLASWKKGTDCCTWFGITCLTSNRVTAVSLSGQPGNRTTSLSGTISPSLSTLRFLDGLYLQDLHNLSGQLPEPIFTLPNLIYIYIENNKLSGPIPPSISKLSQLYALSLEGNRFSGRIPSSLGNLAQLTQLKLDGNLLSGAIPAVLQKLSNLTLLRLDRNQLSGPIPEIFSGLSDLRSLNLSHNKLSGQIPKSISVLAPTLGFLELGHNSLTGSIPGFFGNFRALDTLDLSRNNLSGPVPKSFANLTKIFNLDLSHNRLVDPFPAMNVKGIESLDLSYNDFHLGSIPKWVTSSPIIFSLKLAKCGLKMKLDDFRPAQTYFYDYIDLSENEITGSPARLLNATEYLVGFYAAGNKLKFDLGSLRFAPTLRFLDLSRNLVFGKVPKAVSGLSALNVSRNHLCGALPPNKFPAASFAGNDCLCGSPLPPCKA